MKTQFAVIRLLAILILLISEISFAAELVIGEQELFIEGTNLEFKNRENTMIVVGKVKATSPDFTLWCDHLAVLQSKNQNTSKTDPADQKLEEVHAKENVIVDLKNGYIVSSDRADYSKRDQKIIFTGNAKVQSKTDQAKGCIITYNLKTESYSVESCPEERTKGTLKNNIVR